MMNEVERYVVKVEQSKNKTFEFVLFSWEQAFKMVKSQFDMLKRNKITSLIVSKKQKHQQQEKSSEEEVNVEEEENSNVTVYEVDLLRQQLLLFDRQQDMRSFIETQKCLADDCISQLTDLSFSLMKLSRQLLSSSKPVLSFPQKPHNYSLEQLDKIQTQCFQTLSRLKQQRKRIQSCCICLQNKANTLIMPCMHLVLCNRGCASTLRKCPICMQPIREIREVFR